MSAREDLGLIGWGVASRPSSGDVSGDGYAVCPFPGGTLVAVIDGLGHGSSAASATELAISVLHDRASGDLGALVRACHARLAGSRGAAMSLASFAEDGRMTWLGVGSVDAVLLRSGLGRGRPGREALLLPGGVVGFQLPPLRPSAVDVYRGDTLVLATDGVAPGFSQSVRSGMHPQEAAETVLETYGTFRDDALVLVARYLGREP
jgi:serine phosphatase RsbU (regulator of sigma subunit)